jgi:hypothetical protein
MEARLLDDRADTRQRRGAVTADVVAEHPHRAGGRLGEAEQQPDERGLAGTVGAQEAEGDATRHGEVDAVERRAHAEPLAEAGGLYGEFVGEEGGHAPKVRAGRRAGFGRAAERRRPQRMSLRGRLIRSDESSGSNMLHDPS